ncbi:MAG TPA: hypothetical protein PL151_11030 [Phycisphaerae bacterium]|nr:hypothetical protein [Phycisphaerae bacterium]HOQ86576.1 hypothetical protein [Phycisphaerae bacterium]HPZ98353.1 hypothetical protein [Phycisphaerae bacterium]HQE28285.1 hypothetical protein [Phycisphaerae bacterium]
MEIGYAQIEITPEVGAELSGFAARVQPSTGLLDPLYAKALYVTDGHERLLWIVCDLIGLPREFVEGFRRWALEELDLEPRQVVISTTHTHSGPATIVLHEAGRYDPIYLEQLREQLIELATATMEETEWCELVAVEGRCDLAVDRRGQSSAHTDPRVAAFGWRREDGSFAAVLVNYAMHAVALGPENRRISADWPGRCAAALSDSLTGSPIVLVTNGACGNLNPPFENVTIEQLNEWGGQVAAAVRDLLLEAPGDRRAGLIVSSHVVTVPLEVLSVEQIAVYAEQALRNAAGIREWGDKFRRAVVTWRQHQTDAMQAGTAEVSADIELAAVRLGDRVLLGINAEVFSAFADELRARFDLPVYTIGYTNGLVGYLPTAAAYDEGGYELEMAHLFYDSFRMQRGNLEHLADMAEQFIRDLVG